MADSTLTSSTSTPAGPSRNTSFVQLTTPTSHRFETSPLLGTTPERRVPSLAALGKQMLQERNGSPVVNGGGGLKRDSVEGLASRDGSERELLIVPGGHDESGYTTPYSGSESRRAVVRKHSVAQTIKIRSRYYIPVMDWLPNYEWRTFPNDVVAGCTLACLLIPQAMSYASGLAHLPPVAGLYSSALPGLVYSILGTCKQLSVGPEAALSLLVGQMVQEIINKDPHDVPDQIEQGRIAIAVGVVMTMQVGIITFALGICRLGYLDILLNRALLRGFLTAIATIILIEQLIPMLGLARLIGAVAHSSPFHKFLFLVSNLRHANPYTTTISIVSLTWLIGGRSVKAILRKRFPSINFVPEILVLVIVAVVTTALFRLDLKGVDVLGKLEAGKGLPFGIPLSTKYLKYFHYTFSTSAVIAIVGYVDSVVAAKENSAKYGYAISPNRELVALGASNLAASFLTLTGAVPVFGAITRSRLNGNVGGRSQMSSIVTCFCIIMTSLFLLPYFFYLPKAVLGSIISIVVYSILAELPHDFSFFWRVSAWTDMMQMALTCFLTLFFNVELGLVVSVCFSLILVIQKSTRTRIKIMGRVPGSDAWIPVDEDPDVIEEDLPGVLVVRIRENLNFANSASLRERLRRLELYGAEKAHPSEAPKRDSARAIVFHMNDVEEIDASALQIILNFVQAYMDRDVAIHFVHLRTDQMKAFEVIGLAERLGADHFHADLRGAMGVIEQDSNVMNGMDSSFSRV